MTFDIIWGPARYPALDAEQLNTLSEMSVRVPIVHYTMKGYLSEYAVVKHLSGIRGVSQVAKVPDYNSGHGGDIRFVYRSKLVTVEVKTAGKVKILKSGEKRSTVSFAPTRKGPGEKVKAYRVGEFDMLAISVDAFGKHEVWYALACDLPRHTTCSEYLTTRITLTEKIPKPFTRNPRELLKRLQKRG